MGGLAALALLAPWGPQAGFPTQETAHVGAPRMPLGQWVPGYSLPSQGDHFLSRLPSSREGPTLVDMFIKKWSESLPGWGKALPERWQLLPHRLPAPALLFLTSCAKDPGREAGALAHRLNLPPFKILKLFLDREAVFLAVEETGSESSSVLSKITQPEKRQSWESSLMSWPPNPCL